MNTMLRALIVDDEELARVRIRDLLAVVPDVEIIGECEDGAAAIRAIQLRPPDLLFLDIQMPEIDGFAVLRSVDTARIPAIIFVTAHDEYALQAFEYAALDYLLKPFDQERFEAALERARQRVREHDTEVFREQVGELLAALDRKLLQRLVVRDGGRISFINVREIRWIEAQGNYVMIRTTRESPLLRCTMADIEKRLDPTRFARTHRSSIVNMDRVRRLDPLPHGEYRITLDDGTQLTSRRGFRETLRKRFPDLF